LIKTGSLGSATTCDQSSPHYWILANSFYFKPGDKLLVEKLPGETGGEIVFDQVLLVANGSAETAKIGAPLVPGVNVHARILAQTRDPKKIVFKFTNKTRYKKKRGHRQPRTQIEIVEISARSGHDEILTG